jgi:hypothetical protein
MLTFISYWRAAIVLNDLARRLFTLAASPSRPSGGAVVHSGRDVALFTVRAVYVESCSGFVRGGVYRVVKEAWVVRWLDQRLLSDVRLHPDGTDPVSAGQYIAGLINDIFITLDTHGWIPRAIHAMFHGITLSQSTRQWSYSRLR